MTRRDKILGDALRVFGAPPPEPAAGPELPQVAAARERDRAARARVAAGQDYKPSAAELVEGRAWRRRARL
ncbi:MAG: hypothetical protein C3F11_13980 [Methylocystaceae bacterium]|nr:MAG: hypothetical protein C3F11_13980 [Methylocystaceae bacterium]